MFYYKISNLELMNKKDEALQDLTSITSTEEKVEFIDKQKDGYASKLLKLKETFELDKSSGSIKLREDKFGNVVPNTLSLIAWIKRTPFASDVLNTGNISSSYAGRLNYSYDMDIVTISSDFHHIDELSSYYVFPELVDELFYRLLRELRTEETRYFKAHDEYEVKKQKVREYLDKYHIAFNYKSIITSVVSEKMYVVVDKYEDRTEITMEQLNDLLDKYSQIDDLVNELSR